MSRELRGLRTIVRVWGSPRSEDPGAAFLQGDPDQCVRSRPRSRTIVRVLARPRKGPATCCMSSRASRGGSPMIPRSRSPMSTPIPISPDHEAPNPNNSSKNPMIPVRSPRAVRAVGFSGTYTILHYILWVMFDNFCIWCDIHHPRLS